MHYWYAALLFVIPAFQDPLTVPVESIQLDFGFKLPAWKRVDGQVAPTIVRLDCPKDVTGIPAEAAIPGAIFLIEQSAMEQPRTIKFHREEQAKRDATFWPAYHEDINKEREVGGRPAFTLQFTSKGKDGIERVQIRTSIQRQPKEIFSVISICESVHKDKLAALHDKVLATFRATLGGPTLGTPELARTSGLLAGAAVKPEFAGETWYGIKVGEYRLGHQSVVVTAGKSGYDVAITVTRTGQDGTVAVETAVTTFSADGATQKCVYEGSIEKKGEARVVFKETATIAAGTYTAEREYQGQKETRTFAAPAGLLLIDAAEIVRRQIALAKPDKYAVLTISPFQDLPAVETLEVNAASEFNTADGKQNMILAILGSSRTTSLKQGMFDLKGTLYEIANQKGGGQVIRRMTKEEAQKK